MLFPTGPNVKLKLSFNPQGILAKVDLKEHLGKGLHIESQPPIPLNILSWVESYLNKAPQNSFSFIELKILSHFEKDVLLELSKVPFGKVVSYQELAEKVRSKNHSRAVGNALGKNPFPLFLPCHRVIKSSGDLGGFSCGLNVKKILMDYEIAK